MPRFRARPVEIDAHQWFRNGDHPEDGPRADREGQVVRYFRHPGYNGLAVHGDLTDSHRPECRNIMHDHGWIDSPQGGHVVCPGDWVIRDGDGRFYSANPVALREAFEEA